MNLPRSEYPRPQFVRENWLCLNGPWEFSFDTDSFDRTIIVPYAYQTRLSGIDIQDFHDVVHYRRSFTLPEGMAGKRILLHFGAVDYKCRLWVNGAYVLEHTGGHVGFEADITDYLTSSEVTVTLQVEDPADDLEMPRGKQFWERKSSGIFYTRTTGIWQSVWIEAVDAVYLKQALFTPDIDRMAVDVQYELCGEGPAALTAAVFFEGKEVAVHMAQDIRGSGTFSIGIDQQALGKWQFHEEVVWSPEHPRLFDVVFTVTAGGRETDRVESYFGMRKVSIQNGMFMLNNQPYYQKLLLDQGYWEESLLTAPTDGAFQEDIRLAKEMGFNGVRKHQKVEDPRFLYHADKMGFLVWGEIAAAYAYSRKYVKRMTDEWMDAVLRDYNHPSIVVWTPLNESWGVTDIAVDSQQQSHSAAMVYLTKSLDRTRPVISNDGWEHTCTDLLTIHDYEYRKEVLLERYKDMDAILSAYPSRRFLFAGDWQYAGQPVLVTEFGGISYKKGDWEGWGYSSAVDDEDFADRYYGVVSAMLESPCIQGFCYTQITDVEQEINGLLTYDRKPKIDTAVIRSINEGTYRPKK